jgi:hypothetical protein
VRYLAVVFFGKSKFIVEEIQNFWII